MKYFYFTLSVLVALTEGSYGQYQYRPQQPQYPHHHHHHRQQQRCNPNEKLYQWNAMEFGFPSPQDRQDALDSGRFIPENAMLVDVQPHYDENNGLKTFVTVPKFRSGIPYTLATVTDRDGETGPLLTPYPNYEMHDNKNGADCDAITSAFRVAIDECNNLWVLDSGAVGSDAVCDPQILVFDLDNDEIVHRYRFNTTVYTPGASLLMTPILNVKNPGQCDDVTVYIPDCNHHGMVVYDRQQNNSWRIENIYMYPDPNYGWPSVAGEKFIILDGIFGVATDKKNLYFHALASETENVVPLDVIEDSSLFVNNRGNMIEAFRPLGKRDGVCLVSAMDSKHNLYCVTLDPIKLLKWNVNTPYNQRYIESLPIDPVDLEFVSGIKVVRNFKGEEELWMASNRYQKSATGTRNFNEPNFRVIVHSLEKCNRWSSERRWGNMY